MSSQAFSSCAAEAPALPSLVFLRTGIHPALGDECSQASPADTCDSRPLNLRCGLRHPLLCDNRPGVQACRCAHSHRARHRGDGRGRHCGHGGERAAAGGAHQRRRRDRRGMARMRNARARAALPAPRASSSFPAMSACRISRAWRSKCPPPLLPTSAGSCAPQPYLPTAPAATRGAATTPPGRSPTSCSMRIRLRVFSPAPAPPPCCCEPRRATAKGRASRVKRAHVRLSPRLRTCFGPRCSTPQRAGGRCPLRVTPRAQTSQRR